MVSLDDPASAWLTAHQGRAMALGPGRSSFQYSSNLLPFLSKHLAALDVCIVHGLWQYPGLAVRSAAKKAGKPYFVFPHGMLDPWFKRTYPLKHLKKWLYWPWGEYRVLRDAAGVLFTCEDERILAAESFPQLYRAREVVVGLGLRDAALDGVALAEHFIGLHPGLRGKRVLLFLGRLHPKKGLELLIQAFGRVSAQHPQLRLVIAGAVSGTGVGPDYLTALNELARHSCPPESVIFCGMLDGADKDGALCAAEAFVLTSHQENFGMAVVEALAASLPVLISDKVNIWREIDADRAGLIEPDTLDGTTRLLERWLSLDESQRDDMRSRARDCFQRRFDVQTVACGLVNALERGTLPAV